jgi:pyruvate dehydrogenase E1 component
MPSMPEGAEEGILAGLYLFRPSPIESKRKVRLIGSGSILLQVLRAQEILAEKYGIAADVHSATSYKRLRADALACERWNRFHPDEEARVPYVSRALPKGGGPIVAASDSMKLVPDQIARWIEDPWVSLGTDGYGRSDTRPVLRRWFEVDAETIAAAAIRQLASAGSIPPSDAAKAIRDLGLDPDKTDPLTI